MVQAGRYDGSLTMAGTPTPSTTPILEEATDSSARLDRLWNVIVWDDPVNLMTYVVYVFQRLFGWPREQATVKMLEVHQQGRSLVATEEREKAEHYVTRLHVYGLQATMEPAES